MTTAQTWVRIAGALAGLAVIAIALIEGMLGWDAASIVTLWLLAIAVAFAFWAPTFAQPSPNGDAVRIAMIGPLFVLAGALLAVSAIGLALARGDGSRTTVWVLDVIYLAVLLAGGALLRAAAPVIETGAARPSPAERTVPADDDW